MSQFKIVKMYNLGKVSKVRMSNSKIWKGKKGKKDQKVESSNVEI